MRARSTTVVIAAALVFLLVQGCSKSPFPTPPPQPEVRFVPALTNPGANTISMQTSSSTATSVTITMRINATHPTVGVSFWITYNPSILALATAFEGDFYSRNNYLTAFLWHEESPGLLKISCTRLQTNGRFDGVSGQGELFRFTLNAKGAAGSSSVSYSTTAGQGKFVSDPSNNNIASRFAIAGGTVTVTN